MEEENVLAEPVSVMDDIADETSASYVFNINCNEKNLENSYLSMTKDDLPPGNDLNSTSF